MCVCVCVCVWVICKCGGDRGVVECTGVGGTAERDGLREREMLQLVCPHLGGMGGMEGLARGGGCVAIR